MTEQSLILDTGPFRVTVRSFDRTFLDTVRFFYHDGICTDPDPLVDFDIRLVRRQGARRWVRPQVQFEIDGVRPFEPQPLENAYPVYEWGLNWCIATSAHRYLMLHAGTVAFGDDAMILSGLPGSGKSTLSAALQLRGARLLCDEFGLLVPESGRLLPMPRPIPLKNTSIEAIAAFDGSAPLGPTYPKTRKGRVRHLRPSAASVALGERAATPRWLLFPRYRAGQTADLQALDRDTALHRLALNCFNYKLLGGDAFRALCDLVDQAGCYEFVFSDLNQAVACLHGLAQGEGSHEPAE